MRVQKIRSAVDALQTQDRIILHLACGHNASVWRKTVAVMPSVQVVGLFETGAEWNCDTCPDPPPPTPEDARRTKTANRLWKEVGEP